MCVYFCLLLKLFTPYVNRASVFQWFLGSRPSYCSLISAFRHAVGAVSAPTSRRPLVVSRMTASPTQTRISTNPAEYLLPCSRYTCTVQYSKRNDLFHCFIHILFYLFNFYQYLSELEPHMNFHLTQLIHAEYVTFKAIKCVF